MSPVLRDHHGGLFSDNQDESAATIKVRMREAGGCLQYMRMDGGRRAWR